MGKKCRKNYILSWAALSTFKTLFSSLFRFFKKGPAKPKNEFAESEAYCLFGKINKHCRKIKWCFYAPDHECYFYLNKLKKIFSLIFL